MAEETRQEEKDVGQQDGLLSKKLVRLALVLGSLLTVALVVSLGFALHWYLSPETDLSITERRDLVQGLAAAGQALAVFLTGAVALIGLYLTRQNTNEQLQQARESQERTQRSTQETLRLTEQGQLTERFTRAIDQLGATDDKGKKKLEIRLGGIYALERIDKESPERAYHGTVMEVLTAYVRENSRRGPEEPSTPTTASNEGAEQDKDVEQDEESTVRRPPTDIQAILDVLKRRDEHLVPKPPPHTPHTHRLSLDLRESNLDRANLFGADLQDAAFYGASLRGANLRAANLNGAVLQEANLQGANLERANLRGTNLSGAILYGANLRGARLEQAFLKAARGLTQEQIDWAIGDDTTTLPDGLVWPVAWSKSIGQQTKIIERRLEQIDWAMGRE